MVVEYNLEDLHSRFDFLSRSIENMSLDDQIDISKDGVRVAVIVSSDWLDEMNSALVAINNQVKKVSNTISH